MTHQNRRGFSAIELLIVVIVIGILAAAGMTKYKDISVTARKNSCLSNQAQLVSAMKLIENDSGALPNNTVLRLHSDGTLDFNRSPASPSAAGSYTVFVGTVPPGWNVTNNSGADSQNDIFPRKAQDSRLFRCPEDIKSLDKPAYTNISALLSETAGLRRFAGSYESTDPCVYGLAKAVSTARPNAVFGPAIPGTSADPLEGYNWLRQAVEYQNSVICYCRRYGLRDRDVTGGPATILNGVANDVWYYPGFQERRLAHSSFAPTN
ncbi:MAG: type II secretion system protein [Candidatus Riflebacteria bacterium]|nr:type II secretion system protein [Candidatus Riflebacteria bacterium]